MKTLPRTSAPVSRARGTARPAGRQAVRGLIQVLVGPEPATTWRWRSARQRQVTYAALGVITAVLLALCLIAERHALHQLNGDLGPAPTAVHQISPALAHQQLSAWLVLLTVVVVLPLPLAARHPLLGWRIGWLALLLTPLVLTRLMPGDHWAGSWPATEVQVPVLLTAFCVAGFRQQRTALSWMWALSIIPWWVWVGTGLVDSSGAAGVTVAFTAAAITVDSTRSWRRTQQALAAQTERTELEQGRLAVLQERARIARELHDVVAHHMSLIAVRAESAPYRLSDLAEPVRTEFEALSGEAREALADMRRLLGVLRYDEPAGLAPQPQLSDLPVLVAAARRAGVAVELSVPTGLDLVPAGVGVCAYRIVQESLSNASRHAPGSAVTVSVHHGTDAVVLRVANGPGSSGGRAGTDPGPGHGLVGMRERVALLGGSLSAGPASDGGFVVSAVLPLSQAA